MGDLRWQAYLMFQWGLCSSTCCKCKALFSRDLSALTECENATLCIVTGASVPQRQPKVAVLTYQLPGLTDASSAAVVAEVQAAAAVPDHEVAVSTRHSKRHRVQQSIVSLMPQSKAGQAAAVSKLNSKTRSQEVETVKAVGLASQGRCIRRKVVGSVV